LHNITIQEMLLLQSQAYLPVNLAALVQSQSHTYTFDVDARPLKTPGQNNLTEHRKTLEPWAVVEVIVRGSM